ncbi:ATP-binding protein [Anabaena cylindrica FACHB-243]|uniref:Helicase HerA central domain-containing protein n=1 Tax=Anabaena cylindrica (strain ATCC 27899 / PCC 7122) TaxID=272123 RepID=K9ZRH6_ANACC|nr:MULTISPECIES: DUF87 domain-containing protein [Anabaena]AFZ61369.1 hypothetical protein Anacy_6098 [Anabaena cylindrica PCC 7122]MBD2420365.1 ATP-binding protein [Anabaena cylindrica FACHB-243]MBY5281857.1 ATP-binding protein [Anabaena sp. CCAP 1446/1C]MBY5306994.1 ATP-binding protein [Anabaena sp. CCAP 1446/1C]MCM2406012.1 DUF87 domain-containing protein [Anabaena sp. CCAP 1446/1C]
MPDHNSIQLHNSQPLSSAIQQADVMSLSLLFSLGRYYLDIPFDQSNPIWKINTPKTLLEAPNFLLLEQVGNPVGNATQQPLTALQTALSACHAPGQYSLIFIVTSDGVQNRIYFGVRGHSSIHNSYQFVENLGNFLQGNWSGTRLRRCNNQESPIDTSLHNMDYAVALTGVPSLKPGDGQGYPQTLDRLMRGMRGKKYAYVVIAEPVNRTEVDGVIYQCRNLLGLVHSLTKMNLSLAETEGSSESINYGGSKGVSTSGMNTDFTMSLLLGANGLAEIFPPAGLLAAFASMGLPFLSSKLGWQKTQSDSENINWGNSFSSNFSLSRTIGKEYINAHAQAVESQLERYTTRFEQSENMGCWNVGTYLLAQDPITAQQGATQLKSLLNGEKSCFEPMRMHDLHPIWANGVQVALSDLRQPEIQISRQQEKDIQHPLGNLFNGLTTPLNTEELALLVNLPRQEIPGVRVMPTASFSLNSPVSSLGAEIQLGDLLDGGEPTPLKYKISLKSLTKHTLLTGINGSGKSTTCLKIIREMLKVKIPFLVIEPAKTEYVEWAIAHNQKLPPDSPDRITIYMPGEHSAQKMQELEPLILNPFDIIWLGTEEIPQILSHIDRLKSIFNGSFPMQEVLPILLEEVLFATYRKPFDWLADPLPDFSTSRPTLTQMLDKIRPVIKGKGYEEKIADNLIAALTTRIQSLRQGWKKKLFDQPKSTSWSTLFDRPAVINISYLGDDADKSFTMALILQFLYEYRQAQRDSPIFPKTSAGSLSHLLIIEEAHRIMLRTGQGTVEQANPQAKVAEMFSNILSEIRAYGQGLLVVDQVPSRLIPDAIKNTNLKIVHRLVAADDRQTMGDCMGLNPEQSAIINRLRPGQAIAYGDLDDAAAWIQVTT